MLHGTGLPYRDDGVAIGADESDYEPCAVAGCENDGTIEVEGGDFLCTEHEDAVFHGDGGWVDASDINGGIR